MEGADEDDGNKTHEPTQHKLDEARRKGEIARSADLMTAGAYAGLLLAMLAGGAGAVQTAGTALGVLLERADALAPLMLDRGTAAAPVGGLLGRIAAGFWPFFALPAALALLAALAQRAFVVAPEKLQPKWSRIDPVQNAKNKYGPSGLFEFAKSLAKLVAFSAVLAGFLALRLSEMAGSLHGDPRIVGALMMRIVVAFTIVVLVVSALIGAVDYLWQHHDHLRRNRMSHREVKEEHKQHEGDPHLKQERRQRGQRIAGAQMMAEVPKADVVIVNPTHYAVALKWSRAPGSAPVCVAKGVDHVALRIREVAQTDGVPVHADPPTARALHATTETGAEIAPEHYHAVAAAIRFAEAMRRRARARGWGGAAG